MIETVLSRNKLLNNHLRRCFTKGLFDWNISCKWWRTLFYWLRSGFRFSSICLNGGILRLHLRRCRLIWLFFGRSSFIGLNLFFLFNLSLLLGLSCLLLFLLFLCICFFNFSFDLRSKLRDGSFAIIGHKCLNVDGINDLKGEDAHRDHTYKFHL